MIDYELKSRVLELELDILERQVSKALFYHDFPNENVECELSYDLALAYEDFYIRRHFDLWQEAKKINHARYERVRRLKFYIQRMLNYGDCQFLTFTFNNKILSSTSSKTRKTYVTRFLKNLNTLYVANIDFGKQKGREHFHAVVCADSIDYTSWCGGNLDGEKIRYKSDYAKVSQYVSKLTNHAIKETTKRNSMIYSRMSFDAFEKLNNFKDYKVVEVPCDILPFTEEYYQDDLF